MNNTNIFDDVVSRKILRFERRLAFLNRQIRSIQDDIVILKSNPRIEQSLRASAKLKIQQLEMFGT